MLEKVHLEDLINGISETVIRLNPDFLKNLLVNAAKNNKPWKSEDLADKIGCKYHRKLKCCIAIKNWLNGSRNISFSRLKKIVSVSDYSWKEIEKNVEFIKTKAGGSRIFIEFPIKVGNELGRITGHIIGDGSIDAKLSQIFYSNSDKNLLKEFQHLMLKVFNIKPRIWYQRPDDFKGRKSKWIKRIKSIDEIPEEFQGGLFYPKICSVVIYSILGKFACGKNKKITKQILNTNNDFKINLIRAFFDDEGGPSENSYDIRVFQDDKSILEVFRKLLLELGIVPNKILHYYKNGKKRHYFTITGHYNFLMFYNTIGFTSTDKINELKNMINNVIENNTFRLRKNEARNNIFKLFKTRSQLTTKKVTYLMKNEFPDFKWDKSTILEHLNKLNEKREIKRQKVGFKYIWTNNV
jgi:hypothetical protein